MLVECWGEKWDERGNITRGIEREKLKSVSIFLFFLSLSNEKKILNRDTNVIFYPTSRFPDLLKFLIALLGLD